MLIVLDVVVRDWHLPVFTTIPLSIGQHQSPSATQTLPIWCEQNQRLTIAQIFLEGLQLSEKLTEEKKKHLKVDKGLDSVSKLQPEWPGSVHL